MIKRIGIIGLALCAALALSSLAASTASAAEFECYKINAFKAKEKGGLYKNATCTETAGVLEGEYALAKPVKMLKAKLWCAEMKNKESQEKAEDGYYAFDTCATKLEGVDKNQTNFTEIIKEEEPMTLPEFTTKTFWEAGTSGARTLTTTNGDEWKCKAGTDTGTMEASKKLGTIAWTLTGCTSNDPLSGVSCSSSGDATETILTHGTWHLVLNTISGVDKHLIWLLITPVVINCSIFEFKMSGNLLGSITPANALTKTYHIEVHVPAAGKQEFTTFENDIGEPVKASLELNGEAAFEESAENVITTASDTLIIN
jgi:hypothetical protein